MSAILVRRVVLGLKVVAPAVVKPSGLGDGLRGTSDRISFTAAVKPADLSNGLRGKSDRTRLGLQLLVATALNAADIVVAIT
jgi:hypothetical protein